MQPTLTNTSVDSYDEARAIVFAVANGFLKPLVEKYDYQLRPPTPGDVYVFEKTFNTNRRWKDGFVWEPTRTSRPSFAKARQAIRRFNILNREGALSRLSQRERDKIRSGILELREFAKKGSVLINPSDHFIKIRSIIVLDDIIWTLVAYSHSKCRPLNSFSQSDRRFSTISTSNGFPRNVNTLTDSRHNYHHHQDQDHENNDPETLVKIKVPVARNFGNLDEIELSNETNFHSFETMDIEDSMSDSSLSDPDIENLFALQNDQLINTSQSLMTLDDTESESPTIQMRDEYFFDDENTSTDSIPNLISQWDERRNLIYPSITHFVPKDIITSGEEFSSSSSSYQLDYEAIGRNTANEWVDYIQKHDYSLFVKILDLMPFLVPEPSCFF